jgi:hypothetical protein
MSNFLTYFGATNQINSLKTISFALTEIISLLKSMGFDDLVPNSGY